MDYTQTITIAKNTEVDTIDKALALVTTTNPVIYIRNGEYDVTAMYLMSKANTNITWIGQGINTVIIIQRPANMSNFKGPVHFLKMKFICADSMPAYNEFKYVMAYWTDTTKAVFENCLFSMSKNGKKPNFVFFFLHNSQNDIITNKSFINCTFNAKGIDACASMGRGTFINCLYNTNTLRLGDNSFSTITNCVKDDISQINYAPINYDKTDVGIYGGPNALSLASERITKELGKLLEDNEMLHCLIPYTIES